MFAIVESGSITSMPKGNGGVEIGGVKHSADIFTSKWTESERNAIGVYTVEEDKTNYKDPVYYINTDISYAFGSGKVTGSYGTATERSLVDVKWTQSEIDAGKAPSGADTNTIKQVGLKTKKKEDIDIGCASELAPSDWRVIKEQETGDAMDSGWKTWRGNVRTKCNSMQTQIDNAADMAAFIALFTYTKQGDGSYTRPLGEFPVKE